MKKRILALVLVLVMAIGMTACGGKGSSDGGDLADISGMSLEDIMDAIYKNVNVELPNLYQDKIPADNTAYYLGVENMEFEDAIFSEPMMSSIAYSVCLVRVKDGTDIEATKKAIKEGVDPRKWICVEVAPENIIVDNNGNTIILIMAEACNEIHDAFLKVGK